MGRVQRRKYQRKDPFSGGMLTAFLLALVVAGLFWWCYEPWIQPLLEERQHRKALSGTEEGPADESFLPPSDSDFSAGDEAAASRTPAPPSPGAVTMDREQDRPAMPSVEAPSELDRQLEALYPMPRILPLEEIVNHWNLVPERAFPAEITARRSVPFQLLIQGQVAGSSEAPPGTPLRPVRLMGKQLTVTSLADPNLLATLPVEETDFQQRITQRYEAFVQTIREEVEARRAAAKRTLEASPEKAANLVAREGFSEELNDPRFAPVRASLQQGDVQTAKWEEVEGWFWNGEETVDGDFPGTYETISVRFRVDTIFGNYSAEYKALLRGGRVLHWIDPVTERRI